MSVVFRAPLHPFDPQSRDEAVQDAAEAMEQDQELVNFEDEDDNLAQDEKIDRSKLVTPGQLITQDPQFMRGHGTYADDVSVYATVVGNVYKVNKLLSVRPLKARYNPQIGDFVIGRIVEVQTKRWRVDIGGIQRRKLESDELQMREFFQEGDLVVAEVQTNHMDGSVSIHTRSLKYGKLRNGTLVTVPAYQVVRAKSHHYQFPNNVDVLLGVNGFIWISKHVRSPLANGEHNITRLEEQASLAIYSDQNEEIDQTTRFEIVRLSNCIKILSKYRVPIGEGSLMRAFEASKIAIHPGDLLSADTQQQILSEVIAQD